MALQIFTPPEYTDTEVDIIKEALSNPVVVKYLRGLAQMAASDIAGSSSRLMEEPHLYQVKNAALHGAISALLDLINFAVPDQ